MTTRINEYPFLKQSPTKHHNRQQQMDSPQDTNSDASSNMDYEKAAVTPPTPYYGDDELSGITAVGKSSFHKRNFALSASQMCDDEPKILHNRGLRQD